MHKSESPAKTIQVKISYDPITFKLYSELDTHLASLRNILSSLKNQSYEETASQSISGGFLGLSLVQDKDYQANIERQEVLKTFVSIMRSFIDFIDALLGINSIISDPPKLLKSVQTVGELQKYIDNSIAKGIRRIARNNKLTNVKKLEMLPKLSANYDSAIRGYFALRRAIEHHKGLASATIPFSVQRQALFTDKGEEITSIPVVLKGPSTISVKWEWETKKIK